MNATYNPLASADEEKMLRERGQGVQDKGAVPLRSDSG